MPEITQHNLSSMSHIFHSLLVKYILKIHHPSSLSVTFPSLFLSLPSGEAEGADEWRTQQASLWHGGQASVRVQWETAAAPEERMAALEEKVWSSTISDLISLTTLHTHPENRKIALTCHQTSLMFASKIQMLPQLCLCLIGVPGFLYVSSLIISAQKQVFHAQCVSHQRIRDKWLKHNLRLMSETEDVRLE